MNSDVMRLMPSTGIALTHADGNGAVGATRDRAPQVGIPSAIAMLLKMGTRKTDEKDAKTEEIVLASTEPTRLINTAKN